MHALRIGHQGVELLTTGRISLPVAEPARSELMSIRRGEPPLEQVLEAVEQAIARLEEVRHDPKLPDQPDVDAVDAFVASAYRRAWDAGLYAQL